MCINTFHHVSNRDSVFFYIQHVSHNVRQHCAGPHISFSLETKSLRSAARAASSVTQRLEDHWLGFVTKLVTWMTLSSSLTGLKTIGGAKNCPVYFDD